MKKPVNAWLLLCCALIAAPASADIVDGLNDIRSRGCDGKRGVQAPLRSSRGLNEVAREWSKGGRLREAIARTDYRATNSSSMRVEGTTDDAAILKVLRSNYCEAIVDPSFTEIGVHRRRDGVWVVVATPFVTPSARDASKVSEQVIELVNQARSKPRKCGRESFGPAPPLKLSPTLQRAALAHAQDMSKNKIFQHEGSDGSRPADRVSRTGYRWLTVGENIAAGAADAQTVVQGWLDSPGHCANIMAPQFKEMGVAYVVDRKSTPAIYWAQVFGSSR